MVDDIVTRLRDLREVLMGNPIMAREVQEAMDEIERLRAELDSRDTQAYQYAKRLCDKIAGLEAEIRELGSALTSMSKSRDRAIRALTEAVRGE